MEGTCRSACAWGGHHPAGGVPITTSNGACPSSTPAAIPGVSAPHATVTAGLPGMGWRLPHHTMPPSGGQTLGYKTCVHIPPSCPIRHLPKVDGPLGQPPPQFRVSSLDCRLFLRHLDKAEGNHSSSGLAIGYSTAAWPGSAAKPPRRARPPAASGAPPTATGSSGQGIPPFGTSNAACHT